MIVVNRVPLSDLSDHTQSVLKLRTKKRTPWECRKPSNLCDQEINNKLKACFSEKCGYCERPGHSIDHFRPRYLDRKSNPKPWSRTWNWNNFIWACAECQKHKGSKSYGFIDPSKEDPLEFLWICPTTGMIEGLTPKGKITVKALQLDIPLRSSRRRKIAAIIGWAELLVGENPDMDPKRRKKHKKRLLEGLFREELYLGTFRYLLLKGKGKKHKLMVKLLDEFPEIRTVVNEWLYPNIT
ncbi:MAG: hypothetical protein JW850_06755 [Thermoflexales bacterium]|nr:hypothetical protein [Thermoflexales bacterium]